MEQSLTEFIKDLIEEKPEFELVNLATEEGIVSERNIKWLIIALRSVNNPINILGFLINNHEERKNAEAGTTLDHSLDIIRIMADTDIRLTPDLIEAALIHDIVDRNYKQINFEIQENYENKEEADIAFALKIAEYHESLEFFLQISKSSIEIASNILGIEYYAELFREKLLESVMESNDFKECQPDRLLLKRKIEKLCRNQTGIGESCYELISTILRLGFDHESKKTVVIPDFIKELDLPIADPELIIEVVERYGIHGLVLKAAELINLLEYPHPTNQTSNWETAYELSTLIGPALETIGIEKLAQLSYQRAKEYFYSDKQEFRKAAEIKRMIDLPERKELLNMIVRKIQKHFGDKVFIKIGPNKSKTSITSKILQHGIYGIPDGNRLTVVFKDKLNISEMLTISDEINRLFQYELMPYHPRSNEKPFELRWEDGKDESAKYRVLTELKRRKEFTGYQALHMVFAEQETYYKQKEGLRASIEIQVFDLPSYINKMHGPANHASYKATEALGEMGHAKRKINFYEKWDHIFDYIVSINNLEEIDFEELPEIIQDAITQIDYNEDNWIEIVAEQLMYDMYIEEKDFVYESELFENIMTSPQNQKDRVREFIYHLKKRLQELISRFKKHQETFVSRCIKLKKLVAESEIVDFDDIDQFILTEADKIYSQP